jgi:hypothetical protein
MPELLTRVAQNIRSIASLGVGAIGLALYSLFFVWQLHDHARANHPDLGKKCGNRVDSPNVESSAALAGFRARGYLEVRAIGRS